MNDQLRATIAQFAKPIGVAVTAAIALLALYLLVLVAHKLNTFDDSQYNTITVTGEGESVAVPDIATISFTVEERAPSISDAQAATTRKTDAALAALEGLGVEKRDLKTVGYQMYPEYENQRPCWPAPGMVCPEQGAPRITGYRVSQSIEVTVRDTAKAGEALAALGQAGVQNVSGPNFEVDSDSALATEARDLAIADAREQANRLAKQLGVRLGEVTSFYEEGQSMEPYAMGMGGDAMIAPAMMRAPSLPVGEQERTVRVQVTYRIH